MKRIDEWISEATAKLELEVARLSPKRTDEIFRRLRDQFADSDSRSPLWEAIDDCVSRKRANGWQDVGEYVGSTPCLLITEEDGPLMYRISSGGDLTQVLAACCGFEFYVTNDGCDYLLCHNHHDYLIGVGAAADWVASLADDWPVFEKS